MITCLLGGLKCGIDLVFESYGIGVTRCYTFYQVIESYLAIFSNRNHVVTIVFRSIFDVSGRGHSRVDSKRLRTSKAYILNGDRLAYSIHERLLRHGAIFIFI